VELLRFLEKATNTMAAPPDRAAPPERAAPAEEPPAELPSGEVHAIEPPPAPRVA